MLEIIDLQGIVEGVLLKPENREAVWMKKPNGRTLSLDRIYEHVDLPWSISPGMNVHAYLYIVEGLARKLETRHDSGFVEVYLISGKANEGGGYRVAGGKGITTLVGQTVWVNKNDHPLVQLSADGFPNPDLPASYRLTWRQSPQR